MVRPKSVMSWLSVTPAPACSSTRDAVSAPAPMRLPSFASTAVKAPLKLGSVAALVSR